MKVKTGFILLGILDIIIAIVGMVAFLFYMRRGDILAITAIIISFATFFGLLSIGQSLDKGWASNTGGLRSTMAASIIVVYFFIMPVAIFINCEGELSDLAATMVQNFTTTIGVLIAFYFGASAYVQTHTDEPQKNKK